jgi:very-short-patch-repair endonuclease
MIARRVDYRLTANARALRAGATDAERTIWRLLSRYRPRFTRQLPIGPYIADLACRQARLVVALDGGHHADSTRDPIRTQFLEAEGWTVIRFWNSEVVENPDGVAEAILAKAAECLGGTHPHEQVRSAPHCAAMSGGYGDLLILPSREGRPRRARIA